jgi:fructose-1,6-bisphosphatase/inositol monophosphatase family enzyme
VAVIYLPRRDTLLTAVQGHGCRRDGRPLVPLPQRPLASSLVGAEMGGFIGEEGLHRLLRFPSCSLGLRNVFSTTGNIDDLLGGVTSLFMHLRGGWVWDFAPTALCVLEAGGAVSDSSGQPLEWSHLMGTIRPQGALFASSSDVLAEGLAVLAHESETECA